MSSFLHYHQSVALVYTTVLVDLIVAGSVVAVLAVWKLSQCSCNFCSVVTVLAVRCVSALLCPITESA